MNFKELFGQAWSVLISPTMFYRNMSRSGGLLQPAVFVVLMSVIASIFCSLFDDGAGVIGSFFYGVTFGAIKLLAATFVVGSLLFFLWQRLGSACSYETSLRVVAYGMALAPVFCLLQSLMGWLGVLVTLLWWANVMTIASVETHRLSNRPALWFFIALAFLVFLFDKVGDEEGYKSGERLSSHEQFDAIATGVAVETAQSEKTAQSQGTAQSEQTAEAESTALNLDAGLDLAVTELRAEGQPANSDSLLERSDAPTLTPEEQRQLLDSSNEELLAAADVSETEEVSRAATAATQLGEVLGDVVQQVEKAAENIGQGIDMASEKFKQGLEQSRNGESEASSAALTEPQIDDSAPQADVQSPVSAAEASSPNSEISAELHSVSESDAEKATSLAESAGATLGTVVQELAEMVEGVGEGYKRALNQNDPADKSGAEAAKDGSEQQDDEQNGVQTTHSWTAQELGEAMAKFVLELDSGVEGASGTGDAEGNHRPDSAAESLEQFLEAYRRSLEARKSQTQSK